MKKVHLGCGRNILKNWINVDIIDHPEVMKHDLSLNIPFDDNSIDFFFSEHFFEHLSKEEGLKHLYEIYRCLKPGGVSKIIVPDLDYLVESYYNKNLLAYSSINWKPKSLCDMINIGMKGWNHKYMYNAKELKSVYKLAGFTNIFFTEYNKSQYTDLQGVAFRNYCNELSIEGIKL